MIRNLIVALGTVLVVAVCNGSVQAAQARLHYSTYLHSGPGEIYPVLDEVEHDTLLDLGGCQAGWCKVSVGGVAGWIDAGSVKLPETPPGAPPQAGATCVVAGITSYSGHAPQRFCERAAPVPAPAR